MADSFDPEPRILALGSGLLESMRGQAPSVFNREYWQGRLMEWAMEDPSFKVDLFRFIDVLPSLDRNVSEHVSEYLLREGRELPGLLHGVLRAAGSSLGSTLSSMVVRRQVTELARQFIAGRDVRRSVRRLRRLHDDGYRFSIDLLGEKTLSEFVADRYLERYLHLIEVLAGTVPEWDRDPEIDSGPHGDIPLANVSVKVSALSCHLDPVNPTGSVRDLMRRVLPLMRAARAADVFVNFDMEQWAIHGIITDLFEEIARHPEFADWPHLGFVIQAYLKSATADATRVLSLAQSRGTPLTIRLVKGAYWDHEVMASRQHGTPCPVFTDKADTDASFEALTRFLLAQPDDLNIGFGSHNLRSLSHALVIAEEMGVPRPSCEIQMLYGMAEPERRALRDRGTRVRVYCPVGDLLPGIAYLVRRLLENTANTSFLRLTHHEGQRPEDLLRRPQPRPSPAHATSQAEGFQGCAFTDFTDPRSVRAFARAVDQVVAALPLRVPVVVNGSERKGGASFDRLCPNDGALRVAEVSAAAHADVDRAVAAAKRAAAGWRGTELGHRVALLRRLGDRLEQDRTSLAALQTVETAKPWAEADGDVVEAVDFCRYYARQAEIELSPRPQGRVPGEKNILLFEGRGPAAVIAPWNFPLAILTGMAVAALVAGNPVILKPAEESSAIGYALYRQLIEAGFPADVVQFLPGKGEEIGPRLVSHPDVAQVAFTGSKGVGLSILEAAARTVPGQEHVKRVVCEMGGKNAIIVDEDADVDEAVAGVLRSAFGYAGQKCSACSRVITVGAITEPFLERFLAAVSSLIPGAATDPACELPPVITIEAQVRLLDAIRRAGEELQTLYVGQVPPEGYFVPPAVFRVERRDHWILKEELFGPVLAVVAVETFSESVAVFNDSEFALTGSVYSRLPSHLERARAELRAGNLYLNRGSTGAIVGRQPFGGFRMSGAGHKAGGPGYLPQFVNTRVTTENTSRAGYTPDVEG